MSDGLPVTALPARERCPATQVPSAAEQVSVLDSSLESSALALRFQTWSASTEAFGHHPTGSERSGFRSLVAAIKNVSCVRAQGRRLGSDDTPVYVDNPSSPRPAERRSSWSPRPEPIGGSHVNSTAAMYPRPTCSRAVPRRGIRGILPLVTAVSTAAAESISF